MPALQSTLLQCEFVNVENWPFQVNVRRAWHSGCVGLGHNACERGPPPLARFLQHQRMVINLGDIGRV